MSTLGGMVDCFKTGDIILDLPQSSFDLADT